MKETLGWFLILLVAAPGALAKGVWDIVTGKKCKVKSCGMDKVRDGMCQGHWDGRNAR